MEICPMSIQRCLSLCSTLCFAKKSQFRVPRAALAVFRLCTRRSVGHLRLTDMADLQRPRRVRPLACCSCRGESIGFSGPPAFPFSAVGGGARMQRAAGKAIFASPGLNNQLAGHRRALELHVAHAAQQAQQPTANWGAGGAWKKTVEIHTHNTMLRPTKGMYIPPDESKKTVGCHAHTRPATHLTLQSHDLISYKDGECSLLCCQPEAIPPTLTHA